MGFRVDTRVLGGYNTKCVFWGFSDFFLDAWLRFAPLKGPSACIGERSLAALCSAALRIYVRLRRLRDGGEAMLAWARLAARARRGGALKARPRCRSADRLARADGV